MPYTQRVYWIDVIMSAVYTSYLRDGSEGLFPL